MPSLTGWVCVVLLSLFFQVVHTYTTFEYLVCILLDVDNLRKCYNFMEIWQKWAAHAKHCTSLVQVIKSVFVFFVVLFCTVWDKSSQEQSCWLHLTMDIILHTWALKCPYIEHTYVHHGLEYTVACSILVRLWDIHWAVNVEYCQWIAIDIVNEYPTTWHHTKPTIVRNKPGYISRAVNWELLAVWVQSSHPVQGEFLEDLF